jgi:hypothetical protein
LVHTGFTTEIVCTVFVLALTYGSECHSINGGHTGQIVDFGLSLSADHVFVVGNRNVVSFIGVLWGINLFVVLVLGHASSIDASVLVITFRARPTEGTESIFSVLTWGFITILCAVKACSFVAGPFDHVETVVTLASIYTVVVLTLTFDGESVTINADSAGQVVFCVLSLSADHGWLVVGKSKGMSGICTFKF